MYVFSYPWVLLLILVPVLLRLLLPPHKESRSALYVPWFMRMASLLEQTPGKGAVIVRVGKLELLLLWLMWAALVVAMARPQFLEPPVNKVTPTRDLLLLVDLSTSMDTRDFSNKAGQSVSRLDAVKEVLNEFLAQREGDRVGLIVFGNGAYVQVPFTQDLDTTRLLLEESRVGMAGPRTMFGDAIGLGITLFQESKVKERVMIALTDGNDTGSRMPPVEAARIAADNGILIDVIGIGDPAAVGEEKFDEVTLKKVVSTTGGQYFHAQDRERLEQIYSQLDKINTHEVETVSYRPRRDLFHWPLALFLVPGFLYHLGIALKGRAGGRQADHG